MQNNLIDPARTLRTRRSSTRRTRPSKRCPSRQRSIESLESRQLLSIVPPGYAVPLYQEVSTLNSNGVLTPLATSGPTGYTPAQIRHAYGFDQISFAGGTITGDGAGTTIAIVDAYDDPNIASDLHQFDLAFGLPDPVFTKVNQSGGTTMPQADAGWAGEIALDVQWAHAIAPKANILLVEANDSSYSNLFAAVNYARNVPGVVAVSMSWGSNEFSSQGGYDNYFLTPAGHAGVSFFVASGDSGAPASYPSSSPYVLSVGGTSLYLTGQGNYTSESAWSGSGSGLSRYEAQPSYQKGVVTQSSTARGTPDVAYDADPNTGFPVYQSYGTSAPWAQYGGTSAAAPQWAALAAIADQGRAIAGLASLTSGGLLTALYQMPASYFHDIVTGASFGSTTVAAAAGYDLVTGRGTPIANLIVGALAGSGSVVAPANQFSLSAPSASTAGNTLSVTVSALNASNQAATGYTGSVHFTSSDLFAGLPSDYTFTTADNGVHTFTGLRLVTAGAQTISATDKSNSSLSGAANLNVNPAAADHLAFLQQPSTTVAGAAISPAITVRVLDAFNNLVASDYSHVVAISLGSNPSAASLIGATTATVSGGTATFGNLSVSNSGAGYSLVASSTGLTSAASAAFSVNAASASFAEGFESAVTYTVAGGATATASRSTSAAHDGTYGLLDANGSDWIYRNDAAVQNKPGDTVSVWLQFAGSADGRAYFGFGANSTGTLSLVAAPNTSELQLQYNSGYSYQTIGTVNQTWQANHWYRLDVNWGTSGSIVGKVYDSDGTTLLQSITSNGSYVRTGGIAFRAFGSNKYWDSVAVSPGVNSFGVAKAAATRTLASAGNSLPALSQPVIPAKPRMVSGAVTRLNAVVQSANQRVLALQTTLPWLTDASTHLATNKSAAAQQCDALFAEESLLSLFRSGSV